MEVDKRKMKLYRPLPQLTMAYYPGEYLNNNKVLALLSCADADKYGRH